MRQSWSKGSILAAVVLGAVLSPESAARGGDGPSPGVPMSGLWALSGSGTAYESDGSTSKVKLGTLVAFLDTDGAGVDIAEFSGACGVFPATSGVRLPNAFFAEASGASMAGTVKVDSSTGEGISFKGSALFASGSTIAILTVKAKRVGAPDPASSIFFEDFEGGLGDYVETDLSGAPAATLWHAESFCDVATAIPTAMETTAAAYNRGDEVPPVYTFDTGAANTGAIEGKLLNIKKALGVAVSFDILRDTEGGSSFDQCFFEVRCESDSSWSTVTQITDDDITCGMSRLTVSLGPMDTTLNSVVGGGPFLHRFAFDSVDGVGNDTLGWYVDNVDIGVVKKASSP